MRIKAALLIVVLSLALAPVAAAHPGHDHKIMGTIVSIDGATVLVKTTDGKERTFQLTAATKVLSGKKKGDAAELKPGMRLVVNVGNGAEPLKAKEVQYSPAPAK